MYLVAVPSKEKAISNQIILPHHHHQFNIKISHNLLSSIIKPMPHEGTHAFDFGIAYLESEQKRNESKNGHFNANGFFVANQSGRIVSLLDQFRQKGWDSPIVFQFKA